MDYTIETDPSSTLTVTKGTSSGGKFAIHLSEPTIDDGTVRFRIRTKIVGTTKEYTSSYVSIDVGCDTSIDPSPAKQLPSSYNFT